MNLLPAMTSASQKIKTATSDFHRRAESSAFMQGLIRRELSRERYVSYLRALSVVHAVLETTIAKLAKSNQDCLHVIWRDSLKKTPLLEADTQFLSSNDLRDFHDPVQVALKIAAQIRVQALKNPAVLAGYLYVLEGSTNGSVHLYARVAQAFGLADDNGVKYLKNYGESQPEHWRAFKERFDAALVTEVTCNAAIEGAIEMYEFLIELMAKISADSGAKKVHITAINPEAGSHNVPQIELELKAVSIAAQACLHLLPYVHQRYGDRGTRFTNSDGAWVATLPDLPKEVVFKQINWLGKFLSALGMPRFTLEAHLRETERALSAVLPEQKSKFAVLILAAEHLEEQRRAILPADLQNTLVAKFNSALPIEVDANLKFTNLAQILISAVVDENLDRSGALDKTKAWIDGDSNWPKDIINACLILINETANACKMRRPAYG